MQYFGRKVTHKSVTMHQYSNGYYLAHAADAGEYYRIEITSVEDQGNDIYLVYATYFTPDDNKLSSKDKALVQRINADGKSRFVMLEFQQHKGK